MGALSADRTATFVRHLIRDKPVCRKQNTTSRYMGQQEKHLLGQSNLQELCGTLRSCLARSETTFSSPSRSAPIWCHFYIVSADAVWKQRFPFSHPEFSPLQLVEGQAINNISLMDSRTGEQRFPPTTTLSPTPTPLRRQHSYRTSFASSKDGYRYTDEFKRATDKYKTDVDSVKSFMDDVLLKGDTDDKNPFFVSTFLMQSKKKNNFCFFYK